MCVVPIDIVHHLRKRSSVVQRGASAISEMDRRRCTIGLDVGGTNTDCVVLRGTELIGSAKQPTTENVTSGVESALAAALQDACTRTGGTIADLASQVDQVNIGTTHFVNAVVQRRSLARVAAIRLCGPGRPKL